MAITRYVNAASTGGDGTTNATSGATAAYASLSAAESAEQGDLSSIGLVTFKCEGTTNDTTKVAFAGWTNSSATDYIQIETSDTGIHDGTADSGYVLAISSGHAIEVDIPYTRIGRAGFGIDIKSTSTTSSDEGIRFDLSAADLETCYVVGNIIRSTTSTSSKDGVYCNPSGGTSAITLNVFANIIYGWNRGGVHAQNFSGTNTMLANCIQNTCHGNGDGGSNTGDILGRDTASGTTTIDSFNNICASVTSFRDQAGTSTTWTGSNNVTLDGGYNRGSMTGGAQATSGIAVVTKSTGAWIVFTNITGGSEDYQLLDDAAGNLPVDYGTDKTGTVPSDALGNAYATTPDNGAFEQQAGGASTLVAESGSYVYTGTATALERGLVIPAASGSYAYTGTGVDLNRGFTLTAGSGSYSYSGTAVGLFRDLQLAAASGAYVYSGTAVGLLLGSVLAAGSGSYSYTGTAATLTFAGAGEFDLTAESGAYSYTGTAAGLQAGRSLAADSGGYVYTGTSVGLRRGLVMAAASGSYTYTGTSAGISLGASLAADSGSYTYSGTAIGLLTARVLIAASGSYTYTGTSITLPFSGDLWTEQINATTAWSSQADASTTWTDQSDSSTTWTVQ